MADPESQTEPGAETPLKPNPKAVLMRRSIRGFESRQPKEGAAGTVAAFCCSLIFSLIVIAILNALSVACIVIGAIYLDQENCPGEKNIAPVLIASGVLAIFLSIFEGRSRVKVAKDGETAEEPKKDCFYFVLNIIRLVKLGLFIYLCVLVFTLLPNVKYEPSALPPAPETVDYYCTPTLFLFSYWLVIFVLVCLAIGTFFLCCCCGCLALAALSSKKTDG